MIEVKKDYVGGEEASRECPNCHSKRIWKDGLRTTNNGPVQRSICRRCGYRFSSSTVLSVNRQNSHSRQVCVTLHGAKNLAAATETKTVAGDLNQQDIKGKILEFAFHLKKQGIAQGTIASYVSCLNSLITEGADLFKPDSILQALALNESWNNTTKHTKVVVYQRFADFVGLRWEKPKYKSQRKLPFIPTEQEIDQLIASTPKKTSTILQTLKETGCRIGEACAVRWVDLNEKTMTLTINNPEKNSNPRICRISPKLLAMLNALPHVSDRIFHKTTGKTAQLCLSRARKKAALKLQNPRLNMITHHTLRHWKGTMTYHETHDLVHVQQLLGHKKIDSTLFYVNLESAVFQTENDNFHVQTAKTPEEITKLLEVGFEYVCQKDERLYFRKRK